MRVLRSLSLLAVFPVALAAQTAESVSNAVASITPEDAYRRIGVIAHDSMRGRYTPSPELDLTAEYIAREFQRFGLQPGGDDGTFIQRYEIQQIAMNTAASQIRVTGGPTWRAGEDFVLQRGGGSDPITATVVVIDGRTGDPGAIEGVAAGHVVFVVLSPGPSSRQMFAALRSLDAEALVMVGQPQNAEMWNRLVERQSTPMAQVGERRGGSPWILVRDDLLSALLRDHGYDLAAVLADTTRPITVTQLDDLELTIDLRYDLVSVQTAPNTVGILEGSDPTLRNEYIVFSGHMDHSGIGRPVNGDSIRNGADDDASGTIGVVELAEAFSTLHPRPKRSMIFLTVSGEERNLWGSGHFAANPPVPIEQLVANFNADMIGRNWRDTIVVIGKEHSDLGATLNRVNAEHPELDMTAIDDIWPEENFYNRSDHIHFARRGVPILFFFNGTHEDYHQPSDELEKIDAEKMSRIVKLMFYVGLEVANAPERPQWNPGMIP